MKSGLNLSFFFFFFFFANDDPSLTVTPFYSGERFSPSCFYFARFHCMTLANTPCSCKEDNSNFDILYLSTGLMGHAGLVMPCARSTSVQFTSQLGRNEPHGFLNYVATSNGKDTSNPRWFPCPDDKVV